MQRETRARGGFGRGDGGGGSSFVDSPDEGGGGEVVVALVVDLAMIDDGGGFVVVEVEDEALPGEGHGVRWASVPVECWRS